MDAIVTRPKSKYALKREKKLIDLRNEKEVSVPQPIKKETVQTVRDIVREALYSASGGEAFHRGNAFAIAFNQELNRGEE